MSTHAVFGAQWYVNIHSVKHLLVSWHSRVIGAKTDTKSRSTINHNQDIECFIAALRIPSARPMKTRPPEWSTCRPVTLLLCKGGLSSHSVHILAQPAYRGREHLPADASLKFGNATVLGTYGTASDADFISSVSFLSVAKVILSVPSVLLS